MSTELVKADAYAQASLEERRAYVSAIAQAGDLLPKSLWATTRNQDGSMNPPSPSPAKVLLLAETGSMLGLHPMAALQSIHIIEGKPTLSANLLAALVRRAGHRLRVTTSGSWADGSFVARAVLVRSDDPDFEFVVEWGKERAQRAGLLGKDVWKKYGEAMCKSRAITEVIREGAPDVTIVAAYTPEELGETRVSEDGDVLASVKQEKAAAIESVHVAVPVEVAARGWGAEANDCNSYEELKALYEEADRAGALGLPSGYTDDDGRPMVVGQLMRGLREYWLKPAKESTPEPLMEAPVEQSTVRRNWLREARSIREADALRVLTSDAAAAGADQGILEELAAMSKSLQPSEPVTDWAVAEVPADDSEVSDA